MRDLIFLCRKNCNLEPCRQQQVGTSHHNQIHKKINVKFEENLHSRKCFLYSHFCRKNQSVFILLYNVCISWGKKCSYFGKFGVFCFLVTTVLGYSPFCLNTRRVSGRPKQIHSKRIFREQKGTKWLNTISTKDFTIKTVS